MIEYFLVVIALVYIISATIFDIKTKEVPDWLNFSFIATALFVNSLYSLMFNQWSYIIYSIIGLIVFFLFGSLMYYARQCGGGDTKLLMGLGALLPQYPVTLTKYLAPNLNLPFLVILVMNILVVGGFYGLIYSMVLAIKNKKSFIREFGNLVMKNKGKLNMFFIILVLLLIFIIILDVFIAIPLLILALFMILVYLFVKSVENSSMYKIINVNKLTEGDWVVRSIKLKNKIIYKPNPLGVTKQDITKFKKFKIKKVLVKEGIPFVPAFLIGLIISLVYGNLFLLII